MQNAEKALAHTHTEAYRGIEGADAPVTRRSRKQRTRSISTQSTALALCLVLDESGSGCRLLEALLA